MKNKKESVVIVHNIRSVENVGAMFRTSDAAGVKKIYLTGYTPTPLDRFGRKRGDLAKSALGAEEFVQWEQKKNINSLFLKLKKESYFIVAIEQDKKSVDFRKLNKIFKIHFKDQKESKVAFIVGNEVDGISKSVLEKCDVIAEIPMLGKKESLNVSVSLGIVLFSCL